MVDVLSGQISMDGQTLKLRDVEVTLDEDGMAKLRWLCNSKTESVLAHRTREWDLFFGPYIDGDKTGYIFQIINLYSRKVCDVTVPFGGSIDVSAIKEHIRSIMI